MSQECILSVVVPISRMAGRLENLRGWFENLDPERIETIFVHDIADEATIHELREIIEESKFSNCKVLEGNFGGPGSARNAGISQCKSEWITFWDSDDFVFVNEYLSSIQNLDSTINLLVGNYEIHDIRNGSTITRLLPTSDPLTSLAMNPGIWRMVFRRDAIGNIQFPNLQMAEDQVFICRFLSQNPKIIYTDRVLYRYFIGNQSQLTRNTAALKDLSEASKLTLDVLGNSKNSNSTFTAILFERQIITGIKNGVFRTKVSQLVNQVLAFISLRPSKVLLIARALKFILSDSTRGSHR
jgi:glycosyltransferase involved in cell wall biosynthesis